MSFKAIKHEANSQDRMPKKSVKKWKKKERQKAKKEIRKANE